MAEGNIQIRCPGCGNAQSVAMAVGQQLQCRVCQTVYFAPVLAENQLPGAADQELATAGPLGTNSPSTADRSSTEREPPGRTAVSETRQVDSGSGSRSWRTDGLDLPATPRAPVSAAAQAPGEPVRDGSRIWTVITVLASLVVVVASSLVGVYFMRKGRMAAEQRGARPARSASTGESAQIHWTDASRRAQRLGYLDVKVVQAKYGAVRVKDLNNEVITTDDSNLLAVTVSVHNRSRAPCEFRSWYAGGATDQDGVELLPELVDDAGRAYDLLRFDDVSSIQGQRLADEIEPRHEVQDTVVFLIPPETDRSALRYFHLTLPAHAIGSADFFRFEIPVGMIEGF